MQTATTETKNTQAAKHLTEESAAFARTLAHYTNVLKDLLASGKINEGQVSYIARTVSRLLHEDIRSRTVGKGILARRVIYDVWTKAGFPMDPSFYLACRDIFLDKEEVPPLSPDSITYGGFRSVEEALSEEGTDQPQLTVSEIALAPEQEATLQAFLDAHVPQAPQPKEEPQGEALPFQTLLSLAPLPKDSGPPPSLKQFEYKGPEKLLFDALKPGLDCLFSDNTQPFVMLGTKEKPRIPLALNLTAETAAPYNIQPGAYAIVFRGDRLYEEKGLERMHYLGCKVTLMDGATHILSPRTTAEELGAYKAPASGYPGVGTFRVNGWRIQAFLIPLSKVHKVNLWETLGGKGSDEHSAEWQVFRRSTTALPTMHNNKFT